MKCRDWSSVPEEKVDTESRGSKSDEPEKESSESENLEKENRDEAPDKSFK